MIHKTQKFWTHDEDRQLIEYVRQGMPSEDIAPLLDRTMDSITARLYTLRRKGYDVPMMTKHYYARHRIHKNGQISTL